MDELNCLGKTENYRDKIALLNAYDTNKNGRIDAMEMQQAAADFFDDKLSVGERDIIVHVQNLGEDGISKFCRRRPPCGDYGDVDGDGWVSMNDAKYTTRHTYNPAGYPMTPDQKRRADVNGDGKVTLMDVVLMIYYIRGKHDTFAVCAGTIYLTPDEALLRIHAGEKCYIKCTLPILDMLPGLPYTPGAWIPPFCAITKDI